MTSRLLLDRTIGLSDGIDRLIYRQGPGILNFVTENRPGPRARLLDAATRLTYTEGLTVGVDALLKEAGVVRRSLYDHFGGKDGLLLEVIRQAAAADEQWYRAALDAGGRNPRRRLLHLFDALDTLVTSPEFRGCRYLSADLAIPDLAHPIHKETALYRARLRMLLQAELEALGHPSAARGAETLQLLVEGVLAVGAASASRHPGRVARPLAEVVLDEAAGRPRQRPRKSSRPA